MVERDEGQITGLTGEEEDEAPGEVDHERSRISLLATLGVLVVTILATLSATLAAVYGYDETIANRDRQLWDSYSLALAIQEDNTSSSTAQSDSTQSIAYWRAVFAETMAADASSPAARVELQQEASADAQAAAKSPSQQPAEPVQGGPPDSDDCQSFETTGPGVGEIGTQSDCATQFGAAYGETAEGFLRNERTFLAIASALAISLFLFALSRTLLLVPMQVMFLCVAAAIAIGSAGIGLYELGWRTADQPDAAAIEAYENSDFARAVALAPGYAAAWEGQAAAASGCTKSLQDASEAEQLSPSDINEDYLAGDEMSCGHFASASRQLESALQDPSVITDPWPLGSAAEFVLVTGHPKEADRLLGEAIDYMRSIPASGDDNQRGWVYQDMWFSSILSDQSWISLLDPSTGPRFIDQVEGDEASLDEREATKLPMSSRAMTGVAITDLTRQVGTFCCSAPRPSSSSTTSTVPAFAKPAGLEPPKGVALDTPVEVSFHYSGLEQGDVVTLMWYDSTNSASDVAETFAAVGTPGAPAPGTGTYTTPGWIFAPSGSYRLTVVVNSTFEAQHSVDVPALSP